jgi:hydrogenase maturation protease
MKKFGVIGIGNPLRRDDGIGIILLEKIKEQKKELPNEVEFIDGGTGGMSLLHIFACFDSILIIDAVQMNTTPGTYKIFTADDILINKNNFFISTHEHQLQQVIEMSKYLGEFPKDFFIFGIQPKDTSYSKNLTNDLQTKINILLKSLQDEIKKIFVSLKL